MNRGKTYNYRVLVVISLGVQCYVGYNMIVLMNISNIASSGFLSFQHPEMHVLDDEIKTGKCHIDVDIEIPVQPNPSGRGPGYQYFGAAKKLPGVRELFEKSLELRKRRSRYDIFKRINASYYGYHDDEDEILCYYVLFKDFVFYTPSV
ncbi:hypothetical protein IFM89_037981 [Coptis chinensis]|uniref:Uncharacterized protein n=1 Tax=Coptis chinensis TaxID=261450 RepID=A0A835I8E9_9MAGN|nr:hypothetical protein IFM89_037981 [Coptis chinensis]